MANKDFTLTQKYLKEILHYDPETGDFIWRKAVGNRVHIGDIAGTDIGADKKIYRRIRIARKSYLTHRLAWFYMTGSWPKDEIDHADGNGINNKWRNLSEATRQQNCINMRLAKNNNSGHIGVIWFERSNKWKAYISFNKKIIHLGYYLNKNEAIKARKAAEIKYGFHENHGSDRPL